MSFVELCEQAGFPKPEKTNYFKRNGWFLYWIKPDGNGLWYAHIFDKGSAQETFDALVEYCRERGINPKTGPNKGEQNGKVEI